MKKTKFKFEKELRDKTILITGGSGSIGSYLTEKILDYPVKAVRILDNNEHSLFQLGHQLDDSRLRLLLGSVVDKERVLMAGKDVDIVFHTAAIKNIEITEFNPMETVNTNIIGTNNMIEMAIKEKPKKFLNISTDKAADPTTLYGSTKLLGEKLTTWAGSHTKTTKFGSCRLGNVIESRGNVFETWKTQNDLKKPLSITDPEMKRYFFHKDEAIDYILNCLVYANKGEIFVPKMKLFKIKDLASKISRKHKIIGLRRGEKLEETLMTKEELKLAEEKKDLWIIRNK